MNYLIKKRGDLSLLDAMYKLDEMFDRINELEGELKDLKNNLGL